MGKMQRDKGAGWERDVARRLRDVMPGCDAKRGFQTRGGAAECADVTAGPLHIECKVGKRPPVRAALLTATTTCPKGMIPVAVIKEDRKPPYVVLLLDDFEDFLKEWWERR
tara:strand:- start:1728 stop:2060 length:333 start_codon:yes stop_codon:yes gene_type:complete